jgi:parvulin-like peptidyl-prolyl isomerase
MNMKNLMAAAAAAVVAAGCCDKDKCGDAGKKDAPEGAKAAAEIKLPVAEAKDPNEVVAEVAGEKMTRAELDAKAEALVAAAGNVPPERRNVMRKMAERRVMQTFISDRALRSLAAEKGYSLTDDEIAAKEKEFLARIAGQPGAPKTIDELLALQPGDKEEARASLRNNFLFEKMVEGEVLSKDTADYTAEAQKVIDRISADNAKTLDDEGALKKIGELKADIDAAPDAEKAAKFAALAKEHSACPSGANGGDLGLFGHGQMVPEFDKAAFDLDVGAISGPVKTQFGYHLIMTTEKKKDDDGDKVRASHILVKTGTPQPVPAISEVVAELKRSKNRKGIMDFMMDGLRSVPLKVADEFSDLLPPPKAEPKPAAEPAPAPAPEPAPAEAAPAPAEAAPAE